MREEDYNTAVEEEREKTQPKSSCESSDYTLTWATLREAGRIRCRSKREEEKI